jgi:hypothetical protein
VAEDKRFARRQLTPGVRLGFFCVPDVPGGVSRRSAIPPLECLGRERVTRREGHERVVV